MSDRRRRTTTYQYEPLVTPESWKGDEQRFSQRLTQIIDDLYAKFSRHKERLDALAGEDTDTPSEPEETPDPLESLLPVGVCYTTGTNTDPATSLGFGTWALVDKVFSSAYLTSGFFTPNAEAVSAAVLNLRRSGHSVRIRLNLTLAVDLEEPNVQLGTFDFGVIGLSSLGNTLTVTGYSDGGNGIAFATVSNTAGIMTSIETVTVVSDGLIASGQQVQYDFIMHGNIELMLDGACSHFVWKRTA